jgi:hypothetical protein
VEINSMILSAKHWFLTLEAPFKYLIIAFALLAGILIAVTGRDILKESKN